MNAFQMGSTSTVPFSSIFMSLFLTVVFPIFCGQVRFFQPINNSTLI